MVLNSIDHRYLSIFINKITYKFYLTTFQMASPRAIMGLERLASRSPQCVRNLRLLGSPKSQLTDCEGRLKPCSLSPFNIDTPNRMKILKNGLSDNYSPNVLGSGGFGRVIQASYKGNQVAAKIMKRRKDSDSSVMSENHATFLMHENIIRILGIEQGPALSMITMELCGKSLQERLDESPMNSRDRVDVLKAVSQALKFCHNAGVVHADIKPKNILIAADGKPKLADFGSSFVLGEENERKEIRGTPGYMAPEVIKGDPPSPSSDIYSLGVTAWQMLSRELPFAKMHSHTILYLTGNGMKPQDEQLDDDFGGDYKSLYRKMWSLKKEERPVIDAVLNDLNDIGDRD